MPHWSKAWAQMWSSTTANRTLKTCCATTTSCLHSQDGKALAKSLRVLQRGGQLVSVSGPPDPAFGEAIRAPGFLRMVFRLLSAGTRRRAQALGIGYGFLFMRAQGSQLQEITRLIDAGAIRPVMDKVFAFDATNEAIAYVDTGRAKGKVVVKVR